MFKIINRSQDLFSGREFLNKIFYPNNMYKNAISGFHRNDPKASKLTFYNSKSEKFSQIRLNGLWSPHGPPASLGNNYL